MRNAINYFTDKVKNSTKNQSNNVLFLYHKLKNIPGGLVALSKVISRVAPYFRTVDPTIQMLDVNFCEALMRKNKTVQNHIGTVHVIAICNGLEFVMGVVAEASIPSHLRWLPKGMHVDYVAKANSDIRLVATVDQDWVVGDMRVNVTAYRADGAPVVQGYITIWVTEKKEATLQQHTA